MTSGELLIWTRGPGLAIALTVLLAGVLLRLFEIFSLGRKADLSLPRADTPGSGWRTVFSRTLPAPGMTGRAPVTYFGGYIFHLGLFLIVFLYIPHIELWRRLLGISWPGLPTPMLDAATVATIIAMIAVLISRMTDPVKKMLSGPGDYMAWGLTFTPVIAGYLAYHHLLFDYTWTLAIHILSAELLIAMLPFTKLFHAVGLVIARWYNGDIFGRKGVAS